MPVNTRSKYKSLSSKTQVNW